LEHQSEPVGRIEEISEKQPRKATEGRARSAQKGAEKSQKNLNCQMVVLYRLENAHVSDTAIDTPFFNRDLYRLEIAIFTEFLETGR